MDHTRLLDALSLWGLFVATLAIVALSIEVGYRLGQRRRRRAEQEKDAPVGAIVASTLGLLAFMLAFTFGLAASRFDARRVIVVDEANAIGTTYLRAAFLPDAQRQQSRKLLREYIDARLQAIQPGAIETVITRSDQLLCGLWSQAAQAVSSDFRPIATGLFVESLNNVIDTNSKRMLIALHNRIPELVWLVLYAMAALSMMALGYQEGISGSRRSLAVGALALAFSAVMLLIADLDRPQEGMLRVSQRTMVELRDSLDKYDAASPGM